MKTTVDAINRGNLPRKTTYLPAEAAAALRISLSGVYRRIHDGTLSANKIGGLWRISGPSLWAQLEFVDDISSDDEEAEYAA